MCPWNSAWNSPETKSDGVSQSNINAQKLSKFPIPFCSLPEQKEIGKKIKELNAQVGAIEKSVKIAQSNCEKLTQSILAKVFKGELVPQDSSDEPADKLVGKIAKKNNDRF